MELTTFAKYGFDMGPEVIEDLKKHPRKKITVDAEILLNLLRLSAVGYEPLRIVACNDRFEDDVSLMEMQDWCEQSECFSLEGGEGEDMETELLYLLPRTLLYIVENVMDRFEPEQPEKRHG